MATKPGGIVAAKKRAFAIAFQTPGTPAFQNAAEAWKAAVDPEASQETARRSGGRYLKDAYVREVIAELAADTGQKAAMTPELFVQECLENERKMLEATLAGVKGAPMAAAKYRDLAGRALGLFVQIKKDLTPPPPQAALPNTREGLQALHGALGLMLELNQPVPLPKGSTAPAEDVEFEVVEDDAKDETGA